MLSSCTTEIPSINFGKDYCVFCKMTIMDKKFGAELINKNGKALKFDCGECMIGFVNTDKSFEASKTLIINYTNPEELLEADKSFFLHGGLIKSPMGGQLAAFKTREEAEKFQNEMKADLLLWNKVVNIKF